MRSLSLFTAAALVAASLAPSSFAEGRKPGSALIYPIHRSGAGLFTVVSVTNINTTPKTLVSFGGSTNVHFEYVNVLENPDDQFLPRACFVNDRVEFLTPADTKSVLAHCHNPVYDQSEEGYLVVSAEDPSKFDVAWSHNYLMGSEIVANAAGGVYSINAIPFEAKVAAQLPTDVDGDGELDFNNVEYEGIPDLLYIDSFVAVTGSSLTLINLTGGTEFKVNVQFSVWNDNEFPLSLTRAFKCWFEARLNEVSPVFGDSYLKSNTPDDPTELDVDCDNNDDFETGWAIINGIVANSQVESIPNPALLGAITAGPAGSIGGGRLLWESKALQLNGDFLKFGDNDPEFP